MKVTSSPAISIASVTQNQAASLMLDLREQPKHSTPRAGQPPGADFGFGAASQQLALRRSAAMHQAMHQAISQAWPPREAMQPQYSAVRPTSPIATEDSSEGESKEMPLYPRKVYQYRRLAEADFERSQLGPQDQFEAHDLDELLLEDLRQQLQRYPIAQAQLVKKTLRFFPEQPLYVLLVTPTLACEEPAHPDWASTLGTQIAQELCFSRELLVCLTSETESPLVERIQAKSAQPLWDAAD